MGNKNDSGAGLLNDEKLMKEEEDLFEDDGDDCADIWFPCIYFNVWWYKIK